SPFSSLKDMARIAYPRLPLAGWLAGNRYNSLERIARVSSPTIIVHGEQDEVVPVAQGQKLHQAANEPKHFQLIPGAGHNDTYTAGGSIYWDSLTEFMDTLDR
ncbi:MAG: alpha/beta hydrolase, partial [Chloroflexi bacterium]|nr:alpha/beta hydrolase [Chloroflexota bacterium]